MFPKYCRGTPHQHYWIRLTSRITTLTFLALILIVGNSVSARSQQAPARLSLDDVLQSVRSGETEEVIINRIKRNAKPFDLTPGERQELMREGISETILKYLVDPTLQYTPPAPPAPPPAPVVASPPPAPATPAAPAVPPPPRVIYPDDAFASKIPPEIGGYLWKKQQATKLDFKTLVGGNEGGTESKLTAGLIKKKIVGHLVGPKARTRVDSRPAIFYLRLAEASKIEEIALVVLEAKSQERALEFSSEKGKEAKPILKVTAMRPFDAVEVGPKLYRIAITMIEKGEYFFFLIGSADPDKGIQGKGYDFGVN